MVGKITAAFGYIRVTTVGYGQSHKRSPSSEA
jgi:hypothetical protein